MNTKKISLKISLNQKKIPSYQQKITPYQKKIPLFQKIKKLQNFALKCTPRPERRLLAIQLHRRILAKISGPGAPSLVKHQLNDPSQNVKGQRVPGWILERFLGRGPEKRDVVVAAGRQHAPSVGGAGLATP